MAEPIQTYQKDPTSVRWYGLDWDDWLPADVFIETSTWSVPSDLSVEDEDVGTRQTMVKLSGGALEAEYEVANTITTGSGDEQTETRTICILIVDR